jgi:hypothetical protein
VKRHAARGSLAASGGRGKDAPVEVLGVRTRGRPKASRRLLTSEAVMAMLLELPHP